MYSVIFVRHGMATSSTFVTHLYVEGVATPMNFYFLKTYGHLLHLSQILKWRVWRSATTSLVGKWVAASSAYCISIYYTVLYSMIRCYSVLYCVILYHIILYYSIQFYTVISYTIMYSVPFSDGMATSFACATHR